MLSKTLLSLLAIATSTLGAPSQKALKDCADDDITTTADPGFPIPQPLPFNATIPGVNYDLIAKLRAAPNAIARIAMLEDEDFKFDFINPPNIFGSKLEGKGGTIVNAFAATMPALVDNGMALAVAFNKAWYGLAHS
jgi:hypothetical protein